MGQDEPAKNRNHERISAAVIEEAIDPELKTAVERELCAEDFVFAEDEEERADTDAQECKSSCVALGGIVNCRGDTSP